jgi:hypothetical protein
MSISVGLWMMRLTIWLAVATWLLRVFVEASGREFAVRDRLMRWTWLTGAAACVAHVVCAMGFAHCWSLANAMRHTGQITRQVVGVELPESVFVNFAFTALWVVDAVHEFRLAQPRRLGVSRQLTWSVMMLNATVVFGPRFWTWLAVPCIAALLAVRLLRPVSAPRN